MCDPISLTVAALGGASRFFAADAEAQRFETNARIAESRARAEQARTNFEIERMRQRARRERGRARTGFASAGVQVIGTPVEVLTDLSADRELQARKVQFDSEVAQFGPRVLAFEQREKARRTRLSGLASAARFGLSSLAGP